MKKGNYKNLNIFLLIFFCENIVFRLFFSSFPCVNIMFLIIYICFTLILFFFGEKLLEKEKLFQNALHKNLLLK